MESESDTAITENQTDLKIKTPSRVSRLAGFKAQTKTESPGSFLRGAFRLSSENPRNSQEETSNNIAKNNFNAQSNTSGLFSKGWFSPISPFKFPNSMNSPSREFGQGFSPFQSRSHTPFSQMKSGVVQSSAKNLFGTNSSAQTPTLGINNETNANNNNQRLVQKLDFTTLKTLVLFKDDDNDTEQQVKKEPADLTSQKSTENLSREHSFGGNTTGGGSGYFFGLQKSKYNAANPLPVKPGSSNNSSTFTPALKGVEDEHPINPKLFREKTHFQQALKAHDDEPSTASSGVKFMKRISLDSMNSFILTDANCNISSLFEFNKKQPKKQSNPVIPASVKSNEEQEDMSPISTVTNTKKKVSCNCKKSKCLKLYCDCFGADDMCGPDCNCADCHNNQTHASERKKVRDAILERNPSAFKPKIKKDVDATELGQVEIKPRHDKGCNCKKSGCQKKYCECFAAGLKCSELCKCGSCKNMDPAANQKKLHELMAVTLGSQERSSKGFTNPFEEDEDSVYQRHSRDAQITGEIKTKKIKTVAEVGNFNSFGPNMINEVLKQRLILQHEFPHLQANYHEETVRNAKNLRDSSFMETHGVTESPQILDFFADKLSGEKLRRVPMQKNGLLRPFGNFEGERTNTKYP